MVIQMRSQKDIRGGSGKCNLPYPQILKTGGTVHHKEPQGKGGRGAGVRGEPGHVAVGKAGQGELFRTHWFEYFP